MPSQLSTTEPEIANSVDAGQYLAIVGATTLIQADDVSARPHSRPQANMAALTVVQNSGETVQGMKRTHGSPVSVSGRFFRFVNCGVSREAGLIEDEQEIALTEASAHLVADLPTHSAIEARIEAVGKKGADLGHTFLSCACGDEERS